MVFVGLEACKGSGSSDELVREFSLVIGVVVTSLSIVPEFGIRINEVQIPKYLHLVVSVLSVTWNKFSRLYYESHLRLTHPSQTS